MVVSRLLNWLLPPSCPQCSTSQTAPHQLCASCWKEISFITSPYCEKCGYPLPFAGEPFPICDKCNESPPPYKTARSVMIYNEGAKKLILRFKHADATSLTPTFAHWLVKYGKSVCNGADYLVPVPLHWTRLVRRRYNQSALLTLAMQKIEKNLPLYAPHLLRRKKKTPSQGQKSAEERHLNVKGAFYVPPRYLSSIASKSVVLIDDVMTSGATLEECSHTFLQAGCKEVRVLTLARVLAE